MKLQQLELNAFRAATRPFTIHFDPAKKLTMIFGENGTGKSTIADALTCLCTDGLGSLDDKSGVDKKFLIAANCSPADLSIRLITDKGEYTTRLSGNKFAKDGSRQYPTLRYLRRSQITQLTDATPSKRYEVLESYIDVEQIMKSEEGLRSLVTHLKTDLDGEIRSLTTAQSTLEQAWAREGRPGTGSWKDWADEESTKNLNIVQAQAAAIRNVMNAWQSVTERWQEVQAQQRQCLEAQYGVTEAQALFDRLSASHESVSQDLLKLLEHAEAYLARQSGLHHCPLCEKPIEQLELAALIQQQMDSLKAHQTAMVQLEAAKKTEAAANDLLHNLRVKLAGQFAQFESATTGYAGKPVSLGANDEERLRFLEEKQSSLTAKMAQMEKELHAHEQTLSQHNLIKSQYDAIIRGESKTYEIQALLESAQAAFSIVETTRKSYQQAELSSISDDVDAMYQALHPDEDIGKVRLSMNLKNKKSVDLVARFLHYDTVTPQSVYSESHLDTLSICILLALAKKYSNHDSILLLDDVVNSVDEAHLDRFVNLLHDQQSHFAHIIVTTHYRPWRDRYRHHRYPESHVHFVELRNWKLADGMRQQKGKSQIEELKSALEDEHFDRQAIAAKAGVLLENLLDFLTVAYSCRLRRKPKQDYCLGELLDTVMSKLAKSLRVEHLTKNEAGKYDPALPKKEIPLKPHFDELKKLAFLRNQVGAHFNPLGADVSDTDIFAFGNHTLHLAESLVCPETGHFPDRSPSGEYWETRSKSLRLFPLQEPG